MADHSEHENRCGCGGKTKATLRESPDFTIDRLEPSRKSLHAAGTIHGKMSVMIRAVAAAPTPSNPKPGLN